MFKVDVKLAGGLEFSEGTEAVGVLQFHVGAGVVDGSGGAQCERVHDFVVDFAGVADGGLHTFGFGLGYSRLLLATWTLGAEFLFLQTFAQVHPALVVSQTKGLTWRFS